MPDSDILRLKVLLRFYAREDETPTVTGIAEELGEKKYTISRSIRALAEKGYIDNSDNRHLSLTEKGKKRAAFYAARVKMDAAHLMYEGVDAIDAQNDAYAMAIICSDATHNAINATDQIYRAKYALREQKQITGKEVFSMLEDGRYSFPFVIYRERPDKGKMLSMANNGFEQPCELLVKNGQGRIILRAKEMAEESKLTGVTMRGWVNGVKYMANKKYIPAEQMGDSWSIPAGQILFQNIGSGAGQVLHGSLRLKMRCSVGVVHMPESVAILTLML